MENVFENFVISVLKLYRSVHKIKNYEMREFGLKSVHVMCIYYLDGSEQGLTSGELMRMTLEDKAAISRAVKDLKDKGMAEYDSNKYNSRISLTETGRAVAKSVLEKAARAVSAGSADLTEEERVKFYKTLDEIAVKLARYCENFAVEEE